MLDDVDFITVGDSNVRNLSDHLSSFGSAINVIQPIPGGYVNERMFNTVRSEMRKVSNKFIHVTLHLGGNDLTRLAPDICVSDYISFLTSLSSEATRLRKHCIFTICSIPPRLSRSKHDSRNWHLSEIEKVNIGMEKFCEMSSNKFRFLNLSDVQRNSIGHDGIHYSPDGSKKVAAEIARHWNDFLSFAPTDPGPT